jgi:hypothetical protein
MIRAKFAYDVRHEPEYHANVRAPAVRGARNKGYYFWTPLSLSEIYIRLRNVFHNQLKVK